MEDAASPPLTGARLSCADYEAALMQEMSPAQRTLFHAEMLSVRKDGTTGALFALLLGGFGAHRFYLKDMTGVVYVLFVWTFIPVVVAFFEALVMSARVDRYNKRQAYLIATRIRAYSRA